MASPVHVYIYELSQGFARNLSMPLLGRQIDGVWHTGIVAYNLEYFYGAHGISYVTPGNVIGPPTETVQLGVTEIPCEIFQEYLVELEKDRFHGSKYHVLDHNCNTFSNEVAQFLTGNAIPEKITNLPADVLTTPFGQMIRPLIDSMMNQVNTMPHINTVDEEQAETRGNSNSRQFGDHDLD